MKIPWKGHLNFFDYGEWDVVNERLKDLDKAQTIWCPGRKNLFAALDAVPFDDVKVIIMGQDPYPNPANSTGIAFSIPDTQRTFPPTLATILTELQGDYPDTKLRGDLTPWCKQGVLLWNAYPSCEGFKSNSHHWEEWEMLTQEILQKQSARGIVVCFLGAQAGKLSRHVDETKSYVLKYTHPSPLATRFAQTPFAGCRMFSSINTKLRMLGQPPIDWVLKDVQKEEDGRLEGKVS